MEKAVCNEMSESSRDEKMGVGLWARLAFRNYSSFDRNWKWRKGFWKKIHTHGSGEANLTMSLHRLGLNLLRQRAKNTYLGYYPF